MYSKHSKDLVAICSCDLFVNLASLLCPRVSQPCLCWHFEHGDSLFGHLFFVGQALPFRCPSSPNLSESQMSPAIAKCSLGGKITSDGKQVLHSVRTHQAGTPFCVCSCGFFELGINASSWLLLSSVRCHLAFKLNDNSGSQYLCFVQFAKHFLKNYLFGCTRSWLQHVESLVAACVI